MKSRVRRVLVWCMILVLATAAGALIFAYTYVTDTRTLTALIRAHAPKFFPTSNLKVEHVQLRPLLGLVELTRSTLTQQLGDESFASVSVPWIQVRCDTQSLWKGQFDPREIILAQPILRLTRRDGVHWNLEGLLADPFPTDIEMQPTVRVSRGTIELIEGDERALILHDVDLTFEPDAPMQFRFEGSAQGDALRHLDLAGILDVKTGQVTLTRCDLTGVSLTAEVRDRLPLEWRAAWDELGFSGGELDLTFENFALQRGAPIGPGYRVSLAMRGGVWSCPRLPFPLGEVAARARIVDGRLIVERAEGRYGKTDIVLNSAEIDLFAPDPLASAIRVDITARELELDGRLRQQLPDDLRALWDRFTLDGRDDLGRVTVRATLARAAPDAVLEQVVQVDLLDVALAYDGFAMPLEHLRGRMKLEGDTLTIEHVETVSNGSLLTIDGQISNLATDPTVVLDVEAGSVPIEEAGPLVSALPDSIRALVAQFHPTGTVRGKARIERSPSAQPNPDEPWGDVRVHASLSFNENCSMRWDGLRYPVRRLRGTVELSPQGCVFQDIQGENGVARVIASGRIEALAANQFAADVRLLARGLRFDQELRDALPREWQATWRVLNPIGTCKLDAHVVAGWPNQPDRTHLKIKVDREDEAQVVIMITPAPGTPGVVPGQKIQLPAMDTIRGEFEFDNGLVRMKDVGFEFRQAPVMFKSGSMLLRDTGQFDLDVHALEFSRLRLDAELRRNMPPLMASFAQKLDENKPLRAQGNLKISWSGNTNEPAVCSWDHVKILLNDIKILAGNGTVEHIHGELSDLSGRSDGRSLTVLGRIDADNLIVAGLQLSQVRSPLRIEAGQAYLEDVSAKFLDGDIHGQMFMTLEDIPEYRVAARLQGADLSRLAQSLPGKQELAGKLDAQLEISGVGADMRQVTGQGQAQIAQAELGKLPWYLQLVSQLNLSRDRRAAFDSGHVSFVIKDGAIELNPIKIVGDTLSLQGSGTIDSQGEIDLTFTPLAGRDEKLHIPGLSDLTREAGGQMLRITAKGPIGSPRITPTPVPAVNRRVSDMIRKVTERKNEREAARR